MDIQETVSQYKGMTKIQLLDELAKRDAQVNGIPESLLEANETIFDLRGELHLSSLIMSEQVDTINELTLRVEKANACWNYLKSKGNATAKSWLETMLKDFERAWANEHPAQG